LKVRTIGCAPQRLDRGGQDWSLWMPFFARASGEESRQGGARPPRATPSRNRRAKKPNNRHPTPPIGGLLAERILVAPKPVGCLTIIAEAGEHPVWGRVRDVWTPGAKSSSAGGDRVPRFECSIDGHGNAERATPATAARSCQDGTRRVADPSMGRYAQRRNATKHRPWRILREASEPARCSPAAAWFGGTNRRDGAREKRSATAPIRGSISR